MMNMNLHTTILDNICRVRQPYQVRARALSRGSAGPRARLDLILLCRRRAAGLH